MRDQNKRFDWVFWITFKNSVDSWLYFTLLHVFLMARLIGLSAYLDRYILIKIFSLQTARHFLQFNIIYTFNILLSLIFNINYSGNFKRNICSSLYIPIFIFGNYWFSYANWNKSCGVDWWTPLWFYLGGIWDDLIWLNWCTLLTLLRLLFKN